MLDQLPATFGLLKKLAAQCGAFAQRRFAILALGAIVVSGRRTVSAILGTVAPLLDAHPSSFHRFFSATHLPLWSLAKLLAAAVLACVPSAHVILVVDDTVLQHRGKKVFAANWHRDPVASSRNHKHLKRGHKWVILTVIVILPGCPSGWALPVLAALYVPAGKRPTDASGQVRRRSKAAQRKNKPLAYSKLPVLRKRNAKGVLPKRHKSPALLARQLLALMIHWFPNRKFILVGDTAFGCQDLALFCHRHRRHVTLISRLHPKAALYDLPPENIGRRPGRPRTKGQRLPSPKQAVAAAGELPIETIPWYSHKTHQVQMCDGFGLWYRSRGSGRGGLLPLRWVYTHELPGGRDTYLYSTDPKMAPREIVALFIQRWPIEVTIEEARAHLGLHTPRQRCRQSVLRTTPCLLGLFSVVSLIYAELAKDHPVKLHGTPCYTKTHPTFADALAAVRREIWDKGILPHCIGGAFATNLPPPLKELLLDHLAAAA